MSFQYLLDTNIISEPAKPIPTFVDGQIAS